MADESTNKIRVIVCKVDERAIICNEEGKMMGLPLNRGIRSDEGQLQDIIAGDFFICYAPLESERFLSMPPELEEKYKEKFDLREEESCWE